MRFSFQYKNYPGAPDLTERSKKIGRFTHPMFGFVYALPLFFIFYMMGLLESAVIVCVAGAIVLCIVLPIIRKNMFRKLDEEYTRRTQ